MKKYYLYGIFIILVSILIQGCEKETGILNFTANGEDFSINPFVSKDGWLIDFEQVLINISDIVAYNTSESKLKASLSNEYLIEFSDESFVHVASIKNVPKGNYQSLAFSLKRLNSGAFKGSSIIMIGTAIKNENKIDFIIRLDEELKFDGKDGFVGDSIKGLLNDEETSVEMTFHFDHLFGDITASADDHVNKNSPGFEFFLPYSHDGILNVTQSQLVDTQNYAFLISSIESLGHLGEGHCEVIR